MKEIIKKYWVHLLFLLMINVPILALCTIRTNKYLLLKGDTTPFDSVVEIDRDYVEKGSFSTIYVLSLDNSTIFQNLISKLNPTIENDTISDMVSHISYVENVEAGKIQYNSSIQKSLILAFTEAKKDYPSINIEYKPLGLDVTYYGPNSRFRVGDRIIKINGLGIDAKESLDKIANHHFYVADEITFIRDGRENTISLKKDDGFDGYLMYDINMDTINPRVTIRNNNVGGPSGGLLQSLSIYNRLTDLDITHGLKIAGTGTIDINGKVGPIGGIKQKVPTAFDDKVDIFFCPQENYEDALIAYNTLPKNNSMRLVKIETFYDALRYLKEEA